MSGKYVLTALFFGVQGLVVQSIINLTVTLVEDLISLIVLTIFIGVIYFAKEYFASSQYFFSDKNGKVCAHKMFEILTTH